MVWSPSPSSALSPPPTARKTVRVPRIPRRRDRRTRARHGCGEKDEKPQKGKPVSCRPNAIQSFSAPVRGYFTRRLEVALGRSSGASSIRESKKIRSFGRAIRVIDSQRAGIPRGRRGKNQITRRGRVGEAASPAFGDIHSTSTMNEHDAWKKVEKATKPHHLDPDSRVRHTVPRSSPRRASRRRCRTVPSFSTASA